MTNIPRPALLGVAALVIFAVGLALGWMGGAAHPALPDVPTVADYDGWRLACPAASRKDIPCAITNDLTDSKSGRRVAQLAMVPAKSGAILVVTAPFDVLLPSGIGLVLGNAKPRAYPYLTCNNAGCVAQIQLDDGQLAQMRQGQQGKLLVASLNRKTVEILFSLGGFVRADKALQDRQSGHSFLGL